MPLEFDNQVPTTIETTGATYVQVKGPGSAMEKRVATLQICFRGKGEPGSGNKGQGIPQPRIAIIFRGKGTGLSSQEMDYYSKLDIDVYFSPKAWV